MYLKLALRNIRRSVRDYAIYFITLLFGVAVFYAFNSIGSQQILFDMESSASASVFESTTQLLGMFSVVVACVLGFLILYANQFLIRRRKREFGTYLVLGMTPGHVSRIVLYETVLVGLISLAVGLICGVLLSQALSFFTAALFGTTMSNYQFVFSPDALVVTLACFAAIYVVVALFNTFTVSRCKLIDLIRAGERNERAGVRNPWVCLVVFVAAIAVLAYAYQQLIANGLVMLDQPEFVRATIAMLVGSLMFFWSLAGFAIAVLTRLRGVYLRKLNLFTVRQIASKVNTAFLSLWAVCVLLFFSITVFSSGMGMVDVFVGMKMSYAMLLMMMFILFLILGCILESTSILVLTMPFMYPITQQYGVDAVWFGVFVTMMMVLAGISPPVGLNVFVVRGVCSHIPVMTIYKGAAPFILIMCISILCICIWPDLVLGPVREMMGG